MNIPISGEPVTIKAPPIRESEVFRSTLPDGTPVIFDVAGINWYFGIMGETMLLPITEQTHAAILNGATEINREYAIGIVLNSYITSTVIDGELYVIDGHHRAWASAIKGCEYIPVWIITQVLSEHFMKKMEAISL